MSASLIFTIIKFLKTLKIDGDMTLPCLTPEPTTNEIEVAAFQRTTACSLQYKLAIILTILSGIPASRSDCNNLRWLTLPKALFMSNVAI
jgi:hypothetical protein